jgi:succinate dehydrogenase flavin-adding protein (antitoxin of CptAB toxin-antitoxin module)
MDLLLGRYFDRYGASMSAGELDSFEALIAQADPTLLAWLTGISEPTENHAAVVIAIRRHYLAAR